ncbi:MAG TPA: xanthine dehydrogenase family protein molybdopterin-binding subunit [Thermoanaerobaculia bacterium]|nr:xanthine dehydrogenase family protein molybdopterin-binding subunit [Thermoanaerobaculia bacterium]
MTREKLRLGFNGKFEEKEVEIAPDDPVPWDPSHKFQILGTRVPRLDGPAKVTGEARYAIDQRLPGMLYAKILRSPYPAATVKAVDLTAAKKMSGVRATLAILKPGEKVRFAGQEVAAVAADTPERALDALAAIRVEYQPGPFVVDLEAAKKDGAPAVFEGQVQSKTSAGDLPSARKALPRKGNVQGPRLFEKGNMEEGFRRADVVVEGTYSTQVQTHTALETHGLVARWEGDELTVWASTQGIFSVRDELAEVLGIPASKVHVITEYMGGGFGAKFGARIEGVTAARLAKEAGAPVKLFLDRKEEQLATGNRPSSVQWIKAGATRDGKLTALHLVVHGTGGTNGGTGTSGPLKNIYACDNVKTEEFDVFTNAGPSAAMRAPGHPQGVFALEATMDELAARLGMDPLELRMKNDPSEIRREEFRIGAERIGWASRNARRQTSDPAVRRGFGMGAALWYNTGGTGPKATVIIQRDGSAEVVHGVQDLGTGARTMVGVVAAEELGLPLERVSVRIGDTGMPYGPGSGGSTTTPSSAPAVRAAAVHAKQKMAERLAADWKVPASQIEFAPGTVSVHGDAARKLSWKEACAKLPEEGVSGSGERAENHSDAWKRFTSGAQFAEVEVDTETGLVRVKKIVAVHDCGVVVNALTTESQIQGGIIQGVSYALYENRVLDRDRGLMVNPNVEQYKIAGARDVPEIEVHLVEVWDGVNNTHSVGIGEPATVPTSGAIANAVSHAVGARIRRLPITPESVLAALEEAAGQSKGGRA